MANWLEEEGFVNKSRRDITLSYLRLVFGTSTAIQLKRACQSLRNAAKAHEEENLGKKFKLSWLALRSLAEQGGE